MIGLLPRAVVLAGGRGERFLPLSPSGGTKPFLHLWDGTSLIQDSEASASCWDAHGSVLRKVGGDGTPIGLNVEHRYAGRQR